MKILKSVLIVLGSLVILFVIAFGIFLLVNKQGVIESFEISSPDVEQKVLIASQGSKFKNALVESLTLYLKKKAVYIKVIDVTTLHEVNEEEWDAMVIIHTTEKWELQPDVKKYIDRAENLNKVIFVTTSGSGEWKTKDYDIDVITSASKNGELHLLPGEIVARLDSILSQKPE
ncbi:hypothetical protein AMJ74_00070 [candidate division WOR_3 bacterium SM1_77]|uniref:Uncharacterized protein n=1 Tax=candidate division WOR_3 bacterium SM1_77 TaxID=1703778 RepID=A0A0S8K2H9_UNCW3|nr:MAG: hypothetical protein AMJ74_00070 [candidate division WOR_3 bacterium SM1_77]